MDYASLTPIDPRIIREMKAFYALKYANPSSIYKEGVLAKNAMEDGRKRIADFLNAHSDEIIFTGSGTEANNLALEGCLKSAQENGVEKPHIIVSAIEHSSIMETVNNMEKRGVEVTRLSVDKSGLISLDDLKNALKPNTYLVSIMTVNNEIGTVQPIHEAMKIVRKMRKPGSIYPLFHTDASQAGILYDLNIEKLGIDLLTLDGGKLYGPRGIGMLFVRRNTPISPIIFGGGQERGLRSGTESVPSIMGFAKALDIIAEERSKEEIRISQLKKQFIAGLREISETISLNVASSAPHIVSINIPNIDNEFFVLQMDVAGIACSTKSSCLRDEDESYVLRAIGANSKTSIRFSFGRWTKKRDVKKALLAISHIFC